MKSLLRLCFILTITLVIAACASSMVRVVEVDDLYIIRKPLSENQVKEAIMRGAAAAGWQTKDTGDGHILATYQVRNHTVHVRIDYINTNYSTHYSSSNGMKMFCSERDKETHQLKVSGREKCLGRSGPAYIHGNYKNWIDSLNVAIQNTLAAM